ncbi:MAG TPA: hypothetical protein VK253_07880 [Candidatus Binatia bacterium]|nr:hypothetical protein [Candidatus Binatia bacterium]
MAAVFMSIIAIGGSGIFWLFIMPDVDYWLDTNYYYYQKVYDQWVTRNFQNKHTILDTLLPINCKNNGAMPATFEITITFNGASFSIETSMPYHQINSTAAKFAFTLNSYQEKNTNVYFTLTNTTQFTVTLSLVTNQGLLRVMDAQKSPGLPWIRSYRELHYYSGSDNKLVAAVIS